MSAENFDRAVAMARSGARATGDRMAVRGVYRSGRWKYLAVLATSPVVRR